MTLPILLKQDYQDFTTMTQTKLSILSQYYPNKINKTLLYHANKNVKTLPICYGYGWIKTTNKQKKSVEIRADQTPVGLWSRPPV